MLRANVGHARAADPLFRFASSLATDAPPVRPLKHRKEVALCDGGKPLTDAELTTLKHEYADVLALRGTSKGEILAIARILRANPEMAIDRTAESGEYCFKSGLGTMVHFAAQPERTSEDVLYEFDASGLIAAGLDPARMKQLPELGRMTPGVWYFLPKGQLDPHHAHAMPGPTIAIAARVK